MTAPEELSTFAAELRSIGAHGEEPKLLKALDALESSAEEIGKSWSGSCLGYQSRVYYRDLRPVPAGAHFSQEWGFQNVFSQGSIGDWCEYNSEQVTNEIYTRSGISDISPWKEAANQAAETVEAKKAEIVSLLTAASTDAPTDSFLTKLLEQANEKARMTQRDFTRAWTPSGQFFSRDMHAIQGGIRVPPHLEIIAEVAAIRHPFSACTTLAKLAEKASSHLTRLSQIAKRDKKRGNAIFLGHGRSKLWKELKDFVQDRLRLPWDEFNRVPVAGFTNIARLSQMLDEAAFAFLLLTAEDERIDGKIQARMNVIHEAGLFQGRLGFERAIVLLEHGCEEFSNIQGLGQIRFPKDDISAAFEEIRRVLEREGLIEEALPD